MFANRVRLDFSVELKRSGLSMLKTAATAYDYINENGYRLGKDCPRFSEELFDVNGNIKYQQRVTDFLACRTFILSIQKTSTAMVRKFDSYTLKHRIEECSNYTDYVANGMVLLAAKSLKDRGIEVYHEIGPNGVVLIRTDRDSAHLNRASLAGWKKQVQLAYPKDSRLAIVLDPSGCIEGDHRMFRIAELHERGLIKA